MGRIYREDQHGKLYLDLTVHGKRTRISSGLDDTPEHRKLLKRKLARLEVEQEAGLLDEQAMARHFPRLATKTESGMDTFEQFATRFFDERLAEQELRQSSYEIYNYVLKSLVYPVIGFKQLDEITDADIREIKRTPDLKAHSFNHALRRMRTVFREAMRLKLIKENPAEYVKPIRVARADINPLSIGEIHKVLDAMTDYWRGYFTVALYTGMRPNEQVALKGEDVDAVAGQVYIRRGRVNGRENLPKTESSTRHIDMLPMVVEAFMGIPLKDGLYVWRNPDGRPWDQKYVRRYVWDKAITKAGLAHRSMYQCRHTFVSQMLLADEDINWIARQVGHTNTKMIHEHYGRFISQRMRKDGTRFMAMYQAAQSAELTTAGIDDDDA